MSYNVYFLIHVIISSYQKYGVPPSQYLQNFINITFSGKFVFFTELLNSTISVCFRMKKVLILIYCNGFINENSQKLGCPEILMFFIPIVTNIAVAFEYCLLVCRIVSTTKHGSKYIQLGRIGRNVTMHVALILKWNHWVG